MNDMRVVTTHLDEHTLLIDGMTCAACVSRLERVLNKVPGVVDASVNLATEKARIHASGVPVSALIAAVQKAGFDAQLEPTTWTEAGTSSFCVRLRAHPVGDHGFSSGGGVPPAQGWRQGPGDRSLALWPAGPQAQPIPEPL